MGRTNIEGFSYEGKLQDQDTGLTLEKRFVTVSPLGPNKAGLDTMAFYFSLVGAANRVVGASPTDSIIPLVAHGAQAGDMIQLKVTANTITQRFISVKSAPTANTIELDGVLDAVLTAGDTFDILRPTLPRVDSTGNVLTSGGSGSTSLIQFTLDGSSQTVIEDTVTPANNRPLPVKITSATGAINITAGDLNVQLSHSGASPDSVRIGDGTETLAINASNEAQVADDTARTSLSSISGKLPAVLGQTTKANSLAVVLASDSDALSVSVSSSALPTGAATSAKQDTQITELQDIEADVEAVSAKLPATIGQLAEAGSLSVALATEQDALLTNISTTNSTLAGAVSGSEMQVDIVSLGGGATAANQSTMITELQDIEADVEAMSAKLPASVGAKTSANSLSVVYASDISIPSPVGRTPIQFVRNDYSVTNVTTGAFVELTAALTSACNMIEIFDSSGQTLELATGGSGSEVVKLRIFPGGNGLLPVAFAISTRITIRAVSATANAGEININFYA